MHLSTNHRKYAGVHMYLCVCVYYLNSIFTTFCVILLLLVVRYLTHVYNKVHRYKPMGKKGPTDKELSNKAVCCESADCLYACSPILKYLPAVGRIINISNSVHMTGVTGNVDRFYKIHVTEACRHLSEERTITAGSWG